MSKFTLEDKLNVLFFTLNFFDFKTLLPRHPTKCNELLGGMLLRLRLMLIPADERINNATWLTEPEHQTKRYEVSITSQFVWADVDTGEQITGESVTATSCSLWQESDDETMMRAQLKANDKARLKFVSACLLQNKASNK